MSTDNSQRKPSQSEPEKSEQAPLPPQEQHDAQPKKPLPFDDTGDSKDLSQGTDTSGNNMFV